MIAKKDNSGNITYIQGDHLGSTSIVTNQAGSLVEATSYDPWGQVLSGGTQSKFGYTGQEKDSETGLNYYDSRYYSSAIQHFVQPDTWLPNVYDPQQLNRYSYANNNPLRYTDPTGHFISSIINTINLAVNLFSNKPQEQKKFTPPPTSTAQLPKNVPSTPINIPSSNNTPYTTESQTPSQLTKLGTNVVNNGHADVGVSMPVLGGVVSAGGGVKFDKQGTTQYIAGGVGREIVHGARMGGAVLLSTKSVDQKSTSYNLNFSVVAAAQFSFDPQEPFNRNKWGLEGVGIGCCGIDVTGEYTGSRSPYSSPAPNFLSRPIEEVYGR